MLEKSQLERLLHSADAECVMTGQAMERAMVRSQAERQRRRLVRHAYASVYARLAHLVPVVLPLAGRTRCFPLEGDPREVVSALAASCTFGFETALEIRAGRRLLNVQDVHAYVMDDGMVDGVPGLVGPETVPPRLVPALPRHPHLFLVAVSALPPAVRIGGLRVVSGEWMVREYLGALGHRFDLLAVVLKHLDDEGNG